MTFQIGIIGRFIKLLKIIFSLGPAVCLITALLFPVCSPSPENAAKLFGAAGAQAQMIPFEFALLDTTFGHRKVGDIDLDGLKDIVVGHNPDDAGNIAWYKGPGWTRHLIADITTFSDFKAYRACGMDLADIDSDGDLDIITGEHRGPRRLIIWENTGKGVFTPHLVSTGKENHLGARTADLDGDGDFDLVGICWDDYRSLHIWRNDALKSAH